MRDIHSEDARISLAASMCAAFHHVADRVLKAWYSKMSKRENNQPLLRANTKHSAPVFWAKGHGEETQGITAATVPSHTHGTQSGGSDAGAVSHAGNLGKLSSKRNNGYKAWHGV